MSELTIEELEILKRLQRPKYSFADVQKKLDEVSQSFGFENHQDMLIKTGWLKAVAKSGFPATAGLKVNDDEPIDYSLRDFNE